MPIPLPNLDDRTYDDLVEEARALIPGLTKQRWTNHNPSDPGIAIVELLAWLTEMLLYQVNEIPPEQRVLFLKLLNGPDWPAPGHESELDKQTAAALEVLRTPYRAVTVRDYEDLIRDVRARFAADPPVAVTDHEREELANANRVLPTLTMRRVHCVPGHDLSGTDPGGTEAGGHVSVVVDWESTMDGLSDADVTRALEYFLADRRTLTTRPHVVVARPVPVRVRAVLALRNDTTVPAAFQDAEEALRTFLDPLTGGPSGTGWPFGRPVHASDIYSVLRDVAAVDYVESVGLRRNGTETDPVPLGSGEVVAFGGVELRAYDTLGDAHRWPAS